MGPIGVAVVIQNGQNVGCTQKGQDNAGGGSGGKYQSHNRDIHGIDAAEARLGESNAGAGQKYEDPLNWGMGG